MWWPARTNDTGGHRNKKGVELDLESIMDAKEDEQWSVITPEMLFLRGAITRAKTDEIIKHILLMNSEACNAEKINLFIDSGGGDMAAAYGLIAIMRASEIPVHTIAIGSCASAALMIAMAGAYRQIDKYCTVMSHIFSTANHVMLRPGEVENWVHSLQIDRRAMVSHYIECTGLSATEIQSKLVDENRDIYVTAQEAVGYGMFDCIFKDYSTIHSSTRELKDNEPKPDLVADLTNKLNETTSDLLNLKKLVDTMHKQLFHRNNSFVPSLVNPPVAIAYKTNGIEGLSASIPDAKT